MLFTTFFSMMLREAKEDLTEAIYICLRMDGSVFNLHRLMAHTKTLEEVILELLFADDCVLLAHSEIVLQAIVNCFADAAKAFDLTISLKKTEVLYQKPPRGTYNPPSISISGNLLKTVEHFTYLGSNKNPLRNEFPKNLEFLGIPRNSQQFQVMQIRKTS